MNIYNYADAHRNVFNQMPGLIGLTTFEHKIAFINDNFAKALGYQAADDLVDVAYKNTKCKVAEHHEYFEKQNNIVFSQQKKVSALAYHCYAEHDWKIILSERAPLVNLAGKMIGLINYSIDITSYNLIDCSRFLLESSKKFDPLLFKKGFSYIIEDGTMNHYKLSDRQTECLFFLLRGKSDKEIGSILQLSPRTVETYIDEIKSKMKCRTRSQIIDQAISAGLFNSIPQRFIEKVI